MGDRGRQSGDEIATQALIGASNTMNRPEPPHDLWRDEEHDVWRRVVEALPGDWFSPANKPLLAQYCRHVVQARRVAQMLRQVEHEPGDIDVALWTKLMRAQQAESSAIAALATKMRLSQQST